MSISLPGAVRAALLEAVVFLMPSPCPGCECAVRDWRPTFGLCVHCRGRLRPLGRACSRCGRPLDASALPAGFRCADCRQNALHYDHLVAPFLYEPPLDAVVHQLKFGGLAFLGAHAAEAILRTGAGELTEADVVIPIPLHWRRRIRRGFNQAAEISRPLARSLELPHRTWLRRRRSTTPQATLSRDERRQGPKGAFVASLRAELEGLHVLLVDDVVTTGATADAASATLESAGASRVTVAALARTPPRQEERRFFWQES